MLPLDLHVLGMPPAFNLSQDQTLQFNHNHSKVAYFGSVTKNSRQIELLHRRSCCIFTVVQAPTQVI